MKSFLALRVTQSGPLSSLSPSNLSLDDLKSDKVLVRTHYSSLNYKDALAVTGQGKILRTLPLVPGIDLSGEVVESGSSQFKVGDRVFATGCGLGETLNGGFSQYSYVPENILLKLPSHWQSQDAMVLGTAGFTAALAISRMEQMGQSPKLGPIVVSGASGGVGIFAIWLLSQKGYEVIALTGKTEVHDYLKSIGAHEVCSSAQLELGSTPLGTIRFGGAIDNVGGPLLSQLIAHTQLWGNVCSIGLADRADYQSTVMPMILRGVNLLGVSSANCPMPLRINIWQELASQLSSTQLKNFVQKTLTLEEVYPCAQTMLKRQTFKRYLVKL